VVSFLPPPPDCRGGGVVPGPRQLVAGVPEGIETEQQLSVVRVLGCDEGQGFLFAKPLPPREFAALLAHAPEPAELRRR
jgi:sensor c-di-GMP phosphodiesterase-like protein